MLVLPILEYAAQVCNPHTKKNIDKLEAIQLCGARWVCGSRYNRSTFSWSKPSIQCRNELNWPPLSTRHNYLSLITMHNILHKCSCFDFYSIFPSLPHVLNLIPFLYIVNSQTSILIGIPFLLMVYFYGTVYIHHSVLSISDRSAFKKSLYKFLITQ